MANKSVLGIFSDADTAANATDVLLEAGCAQEDFDVLTGCPYPEGAFGEKNPVHHVYVLPIVGALMGLSVALLLTAGTQIAYPLVTGGKPILSIPPMTIIMYEGTMLGAIIFTVIGIVFESRLPRLFMGAYDTRITEGYIGVVVTSSRDRVASAEDLLRGAGAEDIKRGWEQD